MTSTIGLASRREAMMDTRMDTSSKMIDTMNSYDVASVDAALNEYLQAAYEANGQKIENPNAAIYE